MVASTEEILHPMIVGIIYQRHERIILGNKAGIEEGFFFKDANQIRSVFLGLIISQKRHVQFGVVIVFDVTYNTNNFNLPFAPFTCINHHSQSTFLDVLCL